MFLPATDGAFRHGRAVLGRVSGKRDVTSLALDVLVKEGNVRRRKEGQAHLHEVVKPYRDKQDNADDSPVPQPFPQKWSKGTVRSPRSPERSRHRALTLRERGCQRSYALT